MGQPVSGAWRSFARTEAGRVREHNEDAVLELGAERLWCVADGMGGHHEGAHASTLAVATLRGYRASAYRGIALARLESLVRHCNDELLRHARDRGVDVVGCTLAVLTMHGRSALASWCGDARVYRARRGKLLVLTRDHSAGAESDDRDRHASPGPVTANRSALTAALGGGQTPQLEHSWFALEEDDRFLLCTDGLFKEVSDEEILDHLLTADSAESAVGALCARYHARGARDNVGLVGIATADRASGTRHRFPVGAADTHLRDAR